MFQKKRIIRKLLQPSSAVLEVGCSLGVDSANFIKGTREFLGVDIDPDAIAMARKRFAKHTHMRFICQDACTLTGFDRHFDLILFCGSCHHIPDKELVSIIANSVRYLAKNGKIVIIDYATNPSPGFLARFILGLEEGKYVRTTQEMLSIVDSVETVRVQELTELDIPTLILPYPLVGRRLVLILTRK